MQDHLYFVRSSLNPEKDMKYSAPYQEPKSMALKRDSKLVTQWLQTPSIMISVFTKTPCLNTLLCLPSRAKGYRKNDTAFFTFFLPLIQQILIWVPRKPWVHIVSSMKYEQRHRPLVAGYGSPSCCSRGESPLATPGRKFTCICCEVM